MSDWSIKLRVCIIILTLLVMSVDEGKVDTKSLKGKPQQRFLETER